MNTLLSAVKLQFGSYFGLGGFHFPFADKYSINFCLRNSATD